MCPVVDKVIGNNLLQKLSHNTEVTTVNSVMGAQKTANKPFVLKKTQFNRFSMNKENRIKTFSLGL